jgi:putative ABC transport system permease protein
MLKSLRRKVWGDMRANRGQFIAVWLVVTLGTAFYGAMYPAGVNMLKSIYRTYDQLKYLDFQVQTEAAFAPDTVEQVRAIPGVEAAEGRLIVESGLQPDPAHPYLINLRLISVPDAGQPAVNQLDIRSGHDLHAAGDVLLLERFAKQHGLKAGDKLRVQVGGQMVDLTVAGIVFSPEYLVSGRSPEAPFPTPSTFGVAWMRYSELSALAGRTGEINDIAVHLDGKASQPRTALKASVETALRDLFAGESGVVITGREQTASGGIVVALINGNFPLMRFYSGMFLAGGTIITGILLARLVESERRRIGTLRSLGVTRRELMVHYLTFGLIIGVSGGVAGSILGYLNSFWVMQTFLSYIAGGSLPEFVNVPQIPFILLGFVIVVLGSTFAGIYPAWTQSATPPGIALRPATPKTPNALSRLPLGFLPLALRQTVRNLLRAPGRSIGTALGILSGAMMMFSALAMWDTMNVRFGEFLDANAYDLRVDMNGLYPAGTLEAQMDKIGGVRSAQAALIGPTTAINPGGKAFDTVAISLDGSDPYFHLNTLDGAAAFSRADGVWIGNNLQRMLDLRVGDTLTLRALGQEHQAEVLGVVSYVIGDPVFVPRALMESWIPGGIFPANVVLVRAAPGQKQAVRDAVVGQPGVVAAEVFADFESDLNHYLEYFRAGTIIFGGFGYILTLALLFNTVNASLRERHDELSVLRALGSTRREIALTVTLELLVMVLLGALVGVPLGREMGFWLFKAYEADFYGTVSLIKPISYVIGMASILIVIFLAEIPGLRAVQRADLGQVSKSQSF